MNKLCCLPFTETPEMNMKVNCTSTCCASEMTAKDEHELSFEKSSGDKTAELERKFTFCCGQTKRTFKSHANEDIIPEEAEGK